MSKYSVVIDPSRTVQIILATYLQNAGHFVLTYSTLQEAWQGFAVLQDIPDFIFLFLGYEKSTCALVAHMKSQTAFAGTRIVAMVLQEEQAGIQRTLRQSQVEYLVKPFRMQDVQALVSTPGK
jgi:DNA-binding response OmpR family regulator